VAVAVEEEHRHWNQQPSRAEPSDYPGTAAESSPRPWASPASAVTHGHASPARTRRQQSEPEPELTRATSAMPVSYQARKKCFPGEGILAIHLPIILPRILRHFLCNSYCRAFHKKNKVTNNSLVPIYSILLENKNSNNPYTLSTTKYPTDVDNYCLFIIGQPISLFFLK